MNQLLMIFFRVNVFNVGRIFEKPHFTVFVLTSFCLFSLLFHLLQLLFRPNSIFTILKSEMYVSTNISVEEICIAGFGFCVCSFYAIDDTTKSEIADVIARTFF